MIHWAWLIPAVMAGGMLGVTIMCALILSGEEDAD